MTDRYQHDHPTRTTDARPSGVAVRDGATKGSPHVLDLKPRVDETVAPRRRKLPSRWRRMLDERIHLRDLRLHRSLSVRPRGWKDFPPAGAHTLGQAAWITLVRFFEGHPLAELTALSLLQTVVVLAWRLIVRPAEVLVLRIAGKREAAARIASPMLLPMMPAPVEAPEIMEVREAFRWPSIPRFTFAFEPPRGWYRGVAGFAAVAAVLVLPLSAYGSFGNLNASEDAAIARGIAAVSALKQAGGAVSSNDFAAAGTAFSDANKDFRSAKSELGSMATLLSAASKVAPTSPFSSANNLITAGEQISLGGQDITAGLASLNGDMNPAQRIQVLETHLESALPHLDKAAAAFKKTSLQGVPKAYRPAVATAKQDLPALVAGMHQASDVAKFLLAMLGTDGPKRYLLVFQNNTELRPTGGFIGSFALLDVDKGKVTNVEIPGGGSYDLKGSLTAHLVSPQPLHLINPDWQFQDANWSPDFPTSAKRLAWFYDKSGGPTVDGVIAINANVMSSILNVIGDVQMPGYGVTLDGKNFVSATQQQVEVDYNKTENKPKQFIADLAPKVMDRIVHADRATFLKLMTLLDNALTTKDVQMWFRNANLETQAGSFGWTGATKTGDGDYLEVVHTNIAGQKTDGVMQEKVDHEAKVLPDGETIDTVTITRTHHGVKGTPFTGVRNVDYLRVYVPLGSTLVEARGFDPPDPKLFKFPNPNDTTDPSVALQEQNAQTDETTGTTVSTDLGKTVFGNWVQTDPGQTSVVTLVYKLPPGTVTPTAVDQGPLDKLMGRQAGTRLAYSLLVQKESGETPPAFTSKVDLPRGFHETWSEGQRTTDDRGALVRSLTLDRDSFFGIVAQSP